MEVEICWSWEVPNSIDKTCVVIDVNAATTNIPIFLSKGVKSLTIINEASLLALKEIYQNSLVIGESKILPKKAFHASNLPPDFLHLDFQDKEVLFMSNNGSRVIEKFFGLGVEKIITASFVNAGAIIDYFKEDRRRSVLLVPAGETWFPDKRSMEDYYCAEFIKRTLDGEEPDLEAYLQRSRDFVVTKYNWATKLLADEVAKVEFNPNSYPVIPYCFNDEGIIKVISALRTQEDVLRS